MTASPYLRPTTTQRIRAFFNEIGEKVPPWTGFEEIMDNLWVLLYTRRDDPTFWRSFERLVGSIGSDHARERGEGLPDPQAEILPDEKIGSLVGMLRAAVRKTGGSPKNGAMRRFLKSVNAPLAGCLILLGSAFVLGCDENEKKDAVAALNQYVDDSQLTDAQKESLKSCFAGLEEARREDLVELFRSKSAEEIAAELETMLESGGLCYSGVQDADVADMPDVREGEAPPDVPEEPEPDMVPVYKGVSF